MNEQLRHKKARRDPPRRPVPYSVGFAMLRELAAVFPTYGGAYQGGSAAGFVFVGGGCAEPAALAVFAGHPVRRIGSWSPNSWSRSQAIVSSTVQSMYSAKSTARW